jgi:hypothetical protein
MPGVSVLAMDILLDQKFRRGREPVIRADNERSFNKRLDVLMLVWHAGGRERTTDEHTALLASAGLDVSRIVQTSCGLDIIEAVALESFH